ncbi:hypothetical protein K439DRAFT_375520 [Ramaria rubella]|nr:hypothetical protein K439DRAFT_375520 [Ramaria rubella]
MSIPQSRSSSASSHSSTPTPASASSSSSLHHPLPARPVPDAPDPFTPVHPSFTLMTPTPPPSTSRPQPESPSENKLSRKWRASPLTSELTNTPANPPSAPLSAQPVSLLNLSSSASSTSTSTSTSSTSFEPYSGSQICSQISSPLASAVTAACSTNTPNPLQTTNVYINGLPANYKAEQLYALTSQFGNVLSCRTFTRQLSDHPSGYGFVLFDTIESAQQCIDVLRSHHNLHPTFAKQAHKINRAASAYIPDASACGPSGRLDMDRDDGGADIYIEGCDIAHTFDPPRSPYDRLPMNVEVQTLRALLAPHVVRSSRFFADTRVQPPQLVAFIQLDSRAAAQDVRAKLHGRAIRGYSARLDVTFADDIMPQMSASPRATVGTGPKISSGLVGAYQDPFGPDEQELELAFGNVGARLCGQKQGAMQGMGMSSGHHPTPTIPVPLQPISATLHELQLQLESLRPLLAAYNHSQNSSHTFNINSSQHAMPHALGQTQNSTHANTQPALPMSLSRPRAHSHLNPLASTYTAGGSGGGSGGSSGGSRGVSKNDGGGDGGGEGLNANLDVSAGGAHSRAHTTTGHGLGLGAPLFPHPQGVRRFD